MFKCLFCQNLKNRRVASFAREQTGEGEVTVILYSPACLSGKVSWISVVGAKLLFFKSTDNKVHIPGLYKKVVAFLFGEAEKVGHLHYNTPVLSG